jgi:serine/threonine protein kinase
MTFKKKMRPNASQFPDMHGYALEKLEELNHPLIPKLYYYDDNEYECEFIDGLTLETFIMKTGDYNVALNVLEQVNDLMMQMAKVESNHEWNYKLDLKWRLAAEDIHPTNILIDKNGNPYLIDLDQIGFWHPFTIYQLMMNAHMKLTDCLRYTFIEWHHQNCRILYEKDKE